VSPLAHLFQGSSPFAALGQFLWLLQLVLIVHALRTGRPYWWIWVLLGAPVIGGLGYLVVEMLPGINSPLGFFQSLKPRKWRIADLRTTLAESDTVKNRMALAEALYQAGEFQEAHEIAAACLQGVFKNDPRTLVEVARCTLALGNYAEAYAILERVDLTGNKMLGPELQLQRGQALSGLGRTAEAEECLLRLNGIYVGEAPRAARASLYEKMGRTAEAAALWQDIRLKFRKTGAAWRRSERPWYKLATARLKALKG
jgi:hypothetical protein